ncbi:MAG: alpha/beta hydrolase [Archangium sp.]|nr:alpha/beta hydrolase [Archangium sp.]
MVLKGQFLERPTLIQLTNGLVLEGVSHRGEKRPGLLVLPPPPIEGGGMDHVVGAELAYAISHAGHPTLRFNFRGVGGSQGAVSKSPGDWLDDARAAMDLARENTGGAAPFIATIGASDAIALKLIELEAIAGLVLINPSLARPADFESREKVTWPLGVVVAEHDSSQERGRWAAVLERLDGRFTLIPGANRTYQRNLPMVGQAVASLLSDLTGQGTGGTSGV